MTDYRKCGVTASSEEFSCNILAKEMWTCCIDRNVWLSAVHVPRKENSNADYFSRLLSESTEWKFFPMIFKKHVTHFTSKAYY